MTYLKKYCAFCSHPITEKQEYELGTEKDGSVFMYHKHCSFQVIQ